MRHLLVEIGAQPRQLVGVAQLGGEDDLVMLFGEAQIVEIGNVARQAIGAHRQHAFIAFAAHFGLAVGFNFLRVVIAVAIVGLFARPFGTCVALAFRATPVFSLVQRSVVWGKDVAVM